MTARDLDMVSWVAWGCCCRTWDWDWVGRWRSRGQCTFSLGRRRQFQTMKPKKKVISIYIYIYILKTSTHLLPLIQPNRFGEFTLLNHPPHPYYSPSLSVHPQLQLHLSRLVPPLLYSSQVFKISLHILKKNPSI